MLVIRLNIILLLFTYYILYILLYIYYRFKKLLDERFLMINPYSCKTNEKALKYYFKVETSIEKLVKKTKFKRLYYTTYVFFQILIIENLNV